MRGGEIVGIAGVAGNGQSELVEALVGLRKPDGGRVEVCGRDVTRSRCGDAPRRRSRLYPGGSRRRRFGAGGERRRQSCDGVPSHRSARQRTLHRSVGVRGAGARAHPALRHPNRERARERRNAIGRQSAEDRGCARARPRGAGADRGAADARAGRRRDRSISTSGSSPSATAAARCFWCRRNSAKSSRCPTACWSCSKGASWRICRRRGPTSRASDCSWRDGERKPR